MASIRRFDAPVVKSIFTPDTWDVHEEGQLSDIGSDVMSMPYKGAAGGRATSRHSTAVSPEAYSRLGERLKRITPGTIREAELASPFKEHRSYAPTASSDPFAYGGPASIPGGAGTPPSMGLTSAPTGAAGMKTPGGVGYSSGGSTGALTPAKTYGGLSPKTLAMLAAKKEEAAKKAAEAAKWDVELPRWSKIGGEWYEDSTTYRPDIREWAKTMGMTPEMWTKGGEGLIPYDPRYVRDGISSLGIGRSHLPMERTDPAYHAMGTADPLYYVRPGGKERLAETGKFRDFKRGGTWKSGYLGGRESDGKKWFVNPVTEFTPSWLKPGMTSWPGMPE